MILPPIPNVDAAPGWLRPLVDNAHALPEAYRRRVAPEILEMITAARATAAVTGSQRDAAVLVLFSGPPTDSDALPDDADLLVTVRASTLRHHAGQAAFPGGAADAGDDGPVGTALREANEETGLDVSRLHILATLEKMFIALSGFHVVPVLAYSSDPGPVAVIDEAETAIVARVPVRAFVNPENRIMVFKGVASGGAGSRYCGPAFLLNEMLVWGFTGQIVSALLDVAGWAVPWDTDDIRELQDAMSLVGDTSVPRRSARPHAGYGDARP
ncbi:MAG: NUDIX hydrolase [Mycobacterium sp.]